jgi:2-oxoglutarate dehydrogenase E1 component
MDGNWPSVEADISKKIKAGATSRGAEISASQVQQAARDSVRAIMMIRASACAAIYAHPIRWA